MNKKQFVNAILKNAPCVVIDTATAYAPSNIALCKYWGKQNAELNLPVTSSLSISLGKYGTTTTVSPNDKMEDTIVFNNKLVEKNSLFYQRINEFLNLFRPEKFYFNIESASNIPLAAGLASSASGFASLTLALNNLLQWKLNATSLSLLARLGSGSASRSLWHGFVEWRQHTDPFHSFAEKLTVEWPELAIGLLVFDSKEKYLSSRDAMKATVNTSPFYSSWPTIASNDLETIKHAITTQNFELLGSTSEANAIAMHALMHTARPAIFYHQQETFQAIQTVWQLRKNHIPVYFTQDAGANLKLLFLKPHQTEVQNYFENVKVVYPFAGTMPDLLG